MWTELRVQNLGWSSTTGNVAPSCTRVCVAAADTCAHIGQFLALVGWHWPAGPQLLSLLVSGAHWASVSLFRSAFHESFTFFSQSRRHQREDYGSKPLARQSHFSWVKADCPTLSCAPHCQATFPGPRRSSSGPAHLHTCPKHISVLRRQHGGSARPDPAWLLTPLHWATALRCGSWLGLPALARTPPCLEGRQ